MELKTLHSKAEIFEFLSTMPEQQIYAIGDLDDFFWPKTTWYGLYSEGVIRSLALLYVGMNPATLLLFYGGEPVWAEELLKQLKPFLPSKLNVHLSEGLIDVFGKGNIVETYGHNHKMVLRRTPPEILDDNIIRLNESHLNEIKELYSVSYPGNWFDSRMLETGKYFGYMKSGGLAGIAGIHVYSEEYKVAALGNITTHPDFRRQQIAFKLTSVLCTDLLKTTRVIGLNVRDDNTSAIRCYEKIGFEIVGSFDECLVKNVN